VSENKLKLCASSPSFLTAFKMKDFGSKNQVVTNVFGQSKDETKSSGRGHGLAIDMHRSSSVGNLLGGSLSSCITPRATTPILGSKQNSCGKPSFSNNKK